MIGRKTLQQDTLLFKEKIGKEVLARSFKVLLYKHILTSRYSVCVYEDGKKLRYESLKFKSKSDADSVFEKKRNVILDIIKGTKKLGDL